MRYLRPSNQAARRLVAPAGAVFLLALIIAGCGQQAAAPDFSTQEKLGYIIKSGQTDNVMLTTVAGGAGETYLTWLGGGERFSFSNDGRFFTIVLWPEAQPDGLIYSSSLVIATDGSTAWKIPGEARKPCFSPDSRLVAFSTLSVAGPGTSTISVYDIGSGKIRVLAHGSNLEDPTWVDNGTIVYTEKEGGRVYRVDVKTGAAAALTPPERHFSNYTFPVSRDMKKIALTETGPLFNIWSLDLESGSLTQVTNNVRHHDRAGYLPGSDLILFKEQLVASDEPSSELGVIADDGSRFSLLTSNFVFDGLQTVSLQSGLIAYQRREDPGSSILVGRPDGSETTTIVQSKTDWIGDPNFAPVPQWTASNPLKMSVETGAPDAAGNQVTVHISNPGPEPVEAALRAFPGLDLKISAEEDSPPDQVVEAGEAAAGDPGPPPAKTQWRLQLAPGQSRDIKLDAQVRPTVARAQEATLLFTLDVSGAFPRMYWTDLG